MSFLPRRLRQIPTAGAVVLALTLAGFPGGARAGESPHPTCWGPENSPSDCPDYSAMDPYTYGKYYNRQARPYGYGGAYDRNGYSRPGYGQPYGR